MCELLTSSFNYSVTGESSECFQTDQFSHGNWNNMKILFGILLLLAMNSVLVAGKFTLHIILCSPISRNMSTSPVILRVLFVVLYDVIMDPQIDRRKRVGLYRTIRKHIW